MQKHNLAQTRTLPCIAATFKFLNIASIRILNHPTQTIIIYDDREQYYGEYYAKQKSFYTSMYGFNKHS